MSSGPATVEYADSANELRTLTGGEVGWVAVLAGYYTRGDGGGGVFYWDSAPAADDEGTILNEGGVGTSAAGWRRIYDGALNARWFGAVGDGNTDDHPALQAAINVALASPESLSTVCLPAGNYRITCPLICPTGTGADARGVGLQGAGRGKTTITVDGTSATDGLVYSATEQYGQGGFVHDLLVAGSGGVLNSTSPNSRDLLVIVNWEALEVANSQFLNAGRHSLLCTGAVAITTRNSYFNFAGDDAVVLGVATPYYTLVGGQPVPTKGVLIGTTVNFYACTFSLNAKAGVRILNWQSDTQFYSCVFESSGYALVDGNWVPTNAADGQGIAVWDGMVGLYSPYFEDNTSYDAWFGASPSEDDTGEVTTPGQTRYGPRFVMTDPKVFTGIAKQDACLRVDGGRESSVQGGFFSGPISVQLSGDSRVAMHAFPSDPPNLGHLPVDESVPAPQPLAWEYLGDILATRRYTASAMWAPGNIPSKDYESTNVEIPWNGGSDAWAPQPGDMVSVSFSGGGQGFLFSGQVVQTRPNPILVNVICFNPQNTAAQPSAGSVHVAVLRHLPTLP